MQTHVDQIHGGATGSEAREKSDADFIASCAVSDTEGSAVVALKVDTRRRRQQARIKQKVAAASAGAVAGDDGTVGTSSSSSAAEPTLAEAVGGTGGVGVSL